MKRSGPNDRVVTAHAILLGDRIAVTNHERVLRDRDAIVRVLDDIAADRHRSYPAVGIAINTSR